MKKLLLLILAFITLTNVNAQDITTGLVFHLTGNESISGGVLTSSDASGVSGLVVDTDSNAATITHTTGADGSANGAINIPVGSFIQFAAADIAGLPVGGIGFGRTYSAWVKGGNLLTGNVLAYGNKSTGEHVHFHLQDAGTTVFAGHWSFDWKFEKVPNYADGTWHHIAYKIYEGSEGAIEVEVFIDGDSQGSKLQTNGSGTVMNTNITAEGLTNLTIGQRNGGATDTKDLVGELDDVRIYNRALTTEEFEALFAAKGTVLSVNKVQKTADFNVDTTNSNTIKVVSNVELEKLSIISLNGAIVKDIKANEFINISDLASGLYIVMGQSKNGRSSVKFIKQ